MTSIHEFLAVFIPLFVAIDPFGLIPVFLGVTEKLPAKRRREVTFEAVAAAIAITVVFMFLGRAIFEFLQITVNDFRIAGGILLLVLAVLDLVIQGKAAVIEEEIVGVVPLGMPLIAGPATLTTVLVLTGTHGYALTTLSLVVNFAILLAVTLSAERIARLVGANALRALSKLVMVLLAAIGVSFIRSGLEAIISGR